MLSQHCSCFGKALLYALDLGYSYLDLSGQRLFQFRLFFSQDPDLDCVRFYFKCQPVPGSFQNFCQYTLISYLYLSRSTSYFLCCAHISSSTSVTCASIALYLVSISLSFPCSFVIWFSQMLSISSILSFSRTVLSDSCFIISVCASASSTFS